MDAEKIAAEVFDEATRARASAAEVGVRRERRTVTGVRDGAADTVRVIEEPRVEIRVFLGRRWAQVALGPPSPSSLRKAVRLALSLAEASAEDPHAALVEGAAPVVDVDFCDPAFDGLCSKDRLEMALAIEQAGLSADRRIRASRYVAFEDARTEIRLFNTRGLDSGYAATLGKLSCMFGATDGESGEQLFGDTASRVLSNLDPETLGASVGQRLAYTLGGTPLVTGVRDIVIDRSQVPAMLVAVADALDGDRVHRGLSCLADRVGTDVAAPLVTLRDTPRDRAFPESAPFDDEGVPTAGTSLVDEGVLTSYLYDMASAARAGTTSTGNGRRQIVGAPTRPAPFALSLEPGTGDETSLCAGMDKGLYVTGFMGRGFDPTTGRISAAALGAAVENGEIGPPVSGVTLTGTLEGWLRSIDGIGGKPVFTSGASAPAVRVRDVNVAGIRHGPSR